MHNIIGAYRDIHVMHSCTEFWSIDVIDLYGGRGVCRGVGEGGFVCFIVWNWRKSRCSPNGSHGNRWWVLATLVHRYGHILPLMLYSLEHSYDLWSVDDHSRLAPDAKINYPPTLNKLLELLESDFSISLMIINHRIGMLCGMLHMYHLTWDNPPFNL